MPTDQVIPVEVHHALVAAAYRQRGYDEDEADQAARACDLASWHGIHTHNALKALHLAEIVGAKGGCVPGARIEKLPSRFKAVERWDAHRKLGQPVAFEAMRRGMELADEFGMGAVMVDNAFHYLWGGGYVIEAAKQGYIAHTQCTAPLAEVVPYGGTRPSMGTNPHSWGFPTTEQVGFPICIDWATSIMAMGRVQQHKLEAKALPEGGAVDEQGRPTSDPHRVAALLPFGAHKGYGLSMINELLAAYGGGYLPTLRGQWNAGQGEETGEGEKRSANFFFQVIHPEAIEAGWYAGGKSREQNVQAVLEDIRGPGNEDCLLPGEIEARAARLSEAHGGLLFTDAEIGEFRRIAEQTGVEFEVASSEL